MDQRYRGIFVFVHYVTYVRVWLLKEECYGEDACEEGMEASVSEEAIEGA